jgi:small subunit ribosomal protein S1
MLDKKYDGFFDEETPDDRKSGELLKLIGETETKIKTFSAGDKVSGKVSRVGSEYLYIDVGAKNEALMKISEQTAGVKAGDTVDGFVVSNAGGEMIVSKNLGGQSADISVLMEALNSRMPVQGKVTGVAKAGINVKILGHKAFCPVSQIDVKYTSDVNEYLNKTLEFVITRITEGGRNIVVSRIPLFEAGMEAEFKKLAAAAEDKTLLKGKITKITDFGLFVQTGSLEGLVHISEVSWERAQNLQESFEVGQEVSFVVLKVERKEPLRSSKISLSIRQSLDDPWKKVAQTVGVGQALGGKVTRLADFGAFVEVLPGVEGLVHVSEMAWGKRINHPSEVVKAGQAVKVTVLSIDEKKRSISLTLKDLADDPWNGAEKKFAVGTEVPGTVAKRAKFGYFIDLAEGVTGLLVFSRMAADKKDSIKPGDTVTVTVDSIDLDERRIGLSMGVGEAVKETEAARQFLKKQDAAKTEKKHEASGTEFGAALSAALSSRKAKEPPSGEPVKVKLPDNEEPVKATALGDDIFKIKESSDESVKTKVLGDESVKVKLPDNDLFKTKLLSDESVKMKLLADESVKTKLPDDKHVSRKPNELK